MNNTEKRSVPADRQCLVQLGDQHLVAPRTTASDYLHAEPPIQLPAENPQGSSSLLLKAPVVHIQGSLQRFLSLAGLGKPESTEHYTVLLFQS